MVIVRMGRKREIFPKKVILLRAHRSRLRHIPPEINGFPVLCYQRDTTNERRRGFRKDVLVGRRIDNGQELEVYEPQIVFSNIRSIKGRDIKGKYRAREKLNESGEVQIQAVRLDLWPFAKFGKQFMKSAFYMFKIPTSRFYREFLLSVQKMIRKAKVDIVLDLEREKEMIDGSYMIQNLTYPEVAQTISKSLIYTTAVLSCGMGIVGRFFRYFIETAIELWWDFKRQFLRPMKKRMKTKQTIDEILDSLDTAKKYYFKPDLVSGSGKGVTRISFSGDEVVIETSIEELRETLLVSGSLGDSGEILFNDKETLRENFEDLVVAYSRHFDGESRINLGLRWIIIEEEIPAVTLMGRKIEIRTVVLENGDTLDPLAHYVKMGADGVVANIASGGSGIGLEELQILFSTGAAQTYLGEQLRFDFDLGDLGEILVSNAIRSIRSIVLGEGEPRLVAVDSTLVEVEGGLMPVTMEINNWDIGLTGLWEPTKGEVIEAYGDAITSYLQELTKDEVTTQI